MTPMGDTPTDREGQTYIRQEAGADATTAGPYSIGSRHWPGLSKLIEEMGEAAQVVGKLIATNGHIDQSGMPEWLPVVGYEETYQVSDTGVVRSLARNTTSGKTLSQTIAKRGGYPAVTLTQDGVSRKVQVHKILMAAFVGPRPPGSDIRHLDGDPLNCTLENLAYGSRSENQADALRHGTHNQARKTHCPRGHEYTPANTRVVPSRPNARYCIDCDKAKREREKLDPVYRARRAERTRLSAAAALAADPIGVRAHKAALARARYQRKKNLAHPDFQVEWGNQ